MQGWEFLKLNAECGKKKEEQLGGCDQYTCLSRPPHKMSNFHHLSRDDSIFKDFDNMDNIIFLRLVPINLEYICKY